MNLTPFLHQSYTNEPHTILKPILHQWTLHHFYTSLTLMNLTPFLHQTAKQSYTNEPHTKPITARVVLPQPEPNGQESIGEQERCALVADVVGPMNGGICLGFSL